jgi:predicted XRE-type DNA-binding protein
MRDINKHEGSSFNDFLKETGDYEIVTARAMKRVLAEQLEEEMAARSIKKTQMACMMKTSRSQVDRVLDPDNLSLQLDTLIRAAAAVGKVVDIRFKNAPKIHA